MSRTSNNAQVTPKIIPTWSAGTWVTGSTVYSSINTNVIYKATGTPVGTDPSVDTANWTAVTPILASPGPIGSTTASTGAFTTITTNGIEVGFRNVPQNSKSAAYTLVLDDAGKHIYHPSADTTARTFTIPANASVAYPIGTALTFVNDTSAGVITIAITTDTMVLAGAGTTGSRTLAANGIATAVKTTATRWMISGTGLT